MAVTLRPAPEHSNGTPFAPPPAPPARVSRRRLPVTPLAALTAASTALVGAALIYMMAAIFGEMIPPMLGAAVLSLIAAAVVLSGKRWAPALGSVIAVLLSALLIVPAAAEISHSLTTPGDPIFGVLTVLFPCLFIAFVAGIASTVQNYRWSSAAARYGEELSQPAPGAPRWLAPALIALGGLIVGANVAAARPQQGAAASVSPDLLSTLPSVNIKGFEFQDKEVRVKAGSLVALRLNNADQAPHSFDVDQLGVHAPIVVGQGGVALFQPSKPGTYTFYCAPHYDKASGEGMKGTLIVE
jgi:plastocyanin